MTDIFATHLVQIVLISGQKPYTVDNVFAVIVRRVSAVSLQLFVGDVIAARK
jgi:hypothetical protein